MRAVLESINEDSQCGNAGTTPTLVRYLNDDDHDARGGPSQQYSNEGVQTSTAGTPVADNVLELAIAIEALGITGQAALVSLLICQYCMVLIGTTTR
jgi:hypothetical protein